MEYPPSDVRVGFDRLDRYESEWTCLGLDTPPQARSLSPLLRPDCWIGGISVNNGSKGSSSGRSCCSMIESGLIDPLAGLE